MKTCTGCKITKEEKDFYEKNDKNRKPGLRAQCKACMYEKSRPHLKIWKKDNEHYKAWRKEENKRARLKHPVEYRARQKLGNAIKLGKINKRNSCEICHDGPTHCHHDDYNKPLSFIELCRRCHILLHKQYSEKNIVLF